MKLGDALNMESLRLRIASLRPKIITSTLNAAGIARAVFAMAEREQRPIPDIAMRAWIDEKLSSDKFTLVEARTNRIADPGPRMSAGRVARVLASMDHVHVAPIVVDFNKDDIGYIRRLGYAPKAIVIDGREKFAQANMRGDSTILAFVGNDVLEYVRASVELPSEKITMGIYKRLSKDWDMNAEAAPIIEKVFPQENVFIFSFKQRKYRQPFRVTAEDHIEFMGNPRPFFEETKVEKFTRGTIGAFMRDKQVIQACGCENGIILESQGGGAAIMSKEDHKCITFNHKGGEVKFADILKDYQREGIKARAQIRAVSPPGWEDSTEHMKEDHPEISNPFALSWWMYKKGYEPHHPPGSEKKSKK